MNFNSRIGDKIEWKLQKEQDQNFKMFEKNTLKRTEAEKRLKSKKDEEADVLEWDREKKQ